MSEPERAGAPEDEIEITQEMVEAGTAALATYNDYYERDEDAVRRIYEAMVRLDKGRRPI